MIDVIIPSFKDFRILNAINSLKIYEEINYIKVFKLIIIDGGSDSQLLNLISKVISNDDILLSENDKGIFDALNKGLSLSTSEFIWWIGSDDLMNINLPKEYFNQIKSLSYNYDCFNFKNCYFNEKGLTRSSSINKYKNWYYNYGMELSHFSTIWNRKFIGDSRFDLRYKNAADLDFFYNLVVNRNSKILNFPRVLSFMREGGNSSKNFKARKKNYSEISLIYKKQTNNIIYVIPVLFRIVFKLISTLKLNINKIDINDFSTSINKVERH